MRVLGHFGDFFQVQKTTQFSDLFFGAPGLDFGLLWAPFWRLLELRNQIFQLQAKKHATSTTQCKNM